jgi:hypothetical protein
MVHPFSDLTRPALWLLLLLPAPQLRVPPLRRALAALLAPRRQRQRPLPLMQQDTETGEATTLALLGEYRIPK